MASVSGGCEPKAYSFSRLLASIQYSASAVICNSLHLPCYSATEIVHIAEQRAKARFELEFAAILWRCKMPIDARDAFQRAGNDAVAWRALPDWAGEALLDLQRSDEDS